MARFARKKSKNWQQRFVALLPVIVNYVGPAFRELGIEAKAEAVQEAIANACVAYARLAEQGKESLAFATVLAKYAIAQVRAGRKVGGRLNARDISSHCCQLRKRICLGRLDRFYPVEGAGEKRSSKVGAPAFLSHRAGRNSTCDFIAPTDAEKVRLRAVS
jgi:hypothetical protein